jgi:hypothetical protein
MRVRAIERGFDNLIVREPGDEFDMPDDSFTDKRTAEQKDKKNTEYRSWEAPTWFEPVLSKSEEQQVVKDEQDAERRAKSKAGGKDLV